MSVEMQELGYKRQTLIQKVDRGVNQRDGGGHGGNTEYGRIQQDVYTKMRDLAVKKQELDLRKLRNKLLKKVDFGEYEDFSHVDTRRTVITDMRALIKDLRKLRD